MMGIELSRLEKVKWEHLCFVCKAQYEKPITENGENCDINDRISGCTVRVEEAAAWQGADTRRRLRQARGTLSVTDDYGPHRIEQSAVRPCWSRVRWSC